MGIKEHLYFTLHISLHNSTLFLIVNVLFVERAIVSAYVFVVRFQRAVDIGSLTCLVPLAQSESSSGNSSILPER